jgi:hypothetical protein
MRCECMSWVNCCRMGLNGRLLWTWYSTLGFHSRNLLVRRDIVSFLRRSLLHVVCYYLVNTSSKHHCHRNLLIVRLIFEPWNANRIVNCSMWHYIVCWKLVLAPFSCVRFCFPWMCMKLSSFHITRNYRFDCWIQDGYKIQNCVSEAHRAWVA